MLQKWEFKETDLKGSFEITPFLPVTTEADLLRIITLMFSNLMELNMY